MSSNCPKGGDHDYQAIKIKQVNPLSRKWVRVTYKCSKCKKEYSEITELPQYKDQ